jgi:hypothetical protein
MRLSRLLVYLCVLLAVLVYIFLVELRYKGAESERKDKMSRLLQLDKDSITEIEIVGLKDPAIQIRKIDPDSWRVASPVDTNANTRAVQGLISAAISAQPEKIVLKKDVDWALYGLEKPHLSLSFSAGANAAQISFGASNPSKSSYYSRVHGDPRLFLVADTLEKSLNKTLFAIRDKSVAKFPVEEVTAIEILREGQQTDLQQTEGKWRITHPVDARAKQATVKSFLVNLAELKATEIIDSPQTGNDDSFGFDKSSNRIVLKGKDFSKTLILGAIKEKSHKPGSSGNSIYLRVSGQTSVYVVKDKFLQANKMDADSLTDKSITGFEPIDVEKIEIEFMNRKWLLSKSEDNKWKMEAPEKIGKLDDWMVSGLLWSLKDLNFKLEITPVPENLSDYNLQDPQLKISLHQKKSESPTIIRMGWPPALENPSDKVDSEKDSSQPNDPSGTKKTDIKSVSKTPQIVYAIVEPHIDKPAIFVIDGGFIGRLRVDLDQLERKR